MQKDILTYRMADTLRRNPVLCEYDLDPYETQVKNKCNYYYLFATFENDCYCIKLDKTSDHIIPEFVDHFKVESYLGDQTPDFSFFCFATLPEEALIKFESKLYPYMRDHNIHYPFAEIKINQGDHHY
ncbi:hypothetical protein [Sphingobacterium faecium]|uniref:hypothetical protein n=1 Tax=Sphingobacterium faecium TaxID=34087 RepID=UPI003209D0F3